MPDREFRRPNGKARGPLTGPRASRLLLIVTGLAGASCTAPGPTPADYGARSVAQQDRSAVLDAAEVALVEAGYAIESRDAAEGVVTSRPVEGAPVDDRISSRRRTRRVAEVRVGQRAQTLTVYCKVEIQELATQGYRMFAQERATSDSPGENTPINRDAATTTEQNTVWRTVRRDKPAERRILDGIVANTGGEVERGK